MYVIGMWGPTDGHLSVDIVHDQADGRQGDGHAYYTM